MSTFLVLQPTQLWMLLRADAISVVREPVLLVNLFIGLTLPILLTTFRSEIDAYSASTIGIDSFSAYAVSFALIIPAILVGWVTGMLLLEDRDDGPLLALEVTPVGKGGFILYRSFTLTLIAFAATLFSAHLLLPEKPGLHLPLAFLISLESVLISFTLVAIASNKVEGMALSKILNMLALAPLLALFDAPWRYFLGVVPGFWIGEMLYQANSKISLYVFLIALVVHLGVLLMLYRVLTRRLG